MKQEQTYRKPGIFKTNLGWQGYNRRKATLELHDMRTTPHQERFLRECINAHRIVNFSKPSLSKKSASKEMWKYLHNVDDEEEL